MLLFLKINIYCLDPNCLYKCSISMKCVLTAHHMNVIIQGRLKLERENMIFEIVNKIFGYA